jgi:light-regulated signal transduction histidine kinase (bacteriophytochrome)
MAAPSMNPPQARLVEASLRAEIERLTRRNADLERFASQVSHDLREPLRMISSYAELLVGNYGGVMDAEGIRFLANIVDGATRMSEFLADLLAYTEITARPELPPELVDLNTVLENVKQNLKASIEETEAVISTERLPLLGAHRSDFVSLFQNLLANAIKYHGESPPRIRISVSRGGGEFRFAVSDNGVGIDPVYHRQIFEPFKRLSSTRVPGTGLGLAICQQVISRYGGGIWVESQPGAGATFIFTVPDDRD